MFKVRAHELLLEWPYGVPHTSLLIRSSTHLPIYENENYRVCEPSCEDIDSAGDEESADELRRYDPSLDYGYKPSIHVPHWCKECVVHGSVSPECGVISAKEGKSVYFIERISTEDRRGGRQLCNIAKLTWLLSYCCDGFYSNDLRAVYHTNKPFCVYFVWKTPAACQFQAPDFMTAAPDSTEDIENISMLESSLLPYDTNSCLIKALLQDILLFLAQNRRPHVQAKGTAGEFYFKMVVFILELQYPLEVPSLQAITIGSIIAQQYHILRSFNILSNTQLLNIEVSTSPLYRTLQYLSINLPPLLYRRIRCVIKSTLGSQIFLC